eukprot:TRINITY_DN1401_c0_g1_i3.p1 TRINITY_DN1401_c0_g1~~TRINITY_DN1401_c0_g1_i3.p1  ORF type:complete len:435 (-),score=120.08 TRINITY_DN1401_c0_g1_i3:396-1622(-)
MELRIRECCCSLATFVRIFGLIMIFAYILSAVGVILWYGLFTEENSSHSRLLLVIFILSLSFIFLGILVNLLLLFGLSCSKRTLFLPWLVFHFMIILGCFALGLFIIIHYTILEPRRLASGEEDLEKAFDGDSRTAQVMAVVSVVPLLVGIFLMFMWIFVDQLFIQMRALKKKKGNVEIGASTLSLAYSVKNDPLRPIHSIPVSRRILKQPPPPRYVQSLPRSSGAKARRGGGGGKLSHRPSSASNTTASLHRRRATSRLQKSKSLEQILDSSSSSMSGPHYWISNGQIPSSSSSGSHRSHHKRRREIKSMAPSYCTLDRSSRIPRSSSSPPTARKREVTPPGRSVEFLDAYDEASYLPPPVIDESQPYIGDCDLSGLVPPPPLDSDTAKSVTIATEVTEYRYPVPFI